MREKDELNILPSKYYVGQTLEWDKFLKLSRANKTNQEYIQAYTRRKLRILYSINSINAKNKKVSPINEVHVFLVTVASDKIIEGNWKKIVTALQRGLPYHLIIIFTSTDDEEKYSVAVVECHDSKNSKIKITDAFYITYWMNKDDLREFFAEYKNGLQSPKASYMIDFWFDFVKKVKAWDELRVSYEFYDKSTECICYNNSDGIAALVETLGEYYLENLLYYDIDQSKIFHGEHLIPPDYPDDSISILSDVDHDDIGSAIVDALQAKRIPTDEIEKIANWISGYRREDIIDIYEAYQEGVNLFDSKWWEDTKC